MQGKLDERSSSQLMGVLRDHAEAVAKLQSLLAADLQVRSQAHRKP